MLPSRPNLIRANPLLESYLALSVCWFILLGALLLLFVIILIFGFILSPPPSPAEVLYFLPHVSFYLFMPLWIIPSFALTVLQWRYWKRIEVRRLAAVAGNTSLLALEQPIANPTALSLPCTIKLRFSKEAMPWLVGMALVVTLLISADFAWLDDGFLFISPDRFHNFLVLFAIIFPLMVILPLAIFLSPLGQQKIEVTERGLRVRYGGQKGIVSWQEARLFAMYETFGEQKSSSITFELSSGRDIARWIWIRRHKRFHMNMVPTVPFDEYQWQMQSLNALIVARTGLPLADLRTEPVEDLL